MKRIMFALFFGMLAIPAWAGTLSSTLTWSNPVDTTDGVQIEKASAVTGTFTVISKTTPGTASYVDATNSPGDTACYRIAYFNSSGLGPYAGPAGDCKTFPPVPASAPATFTVN